MMEFLLLDVGFVVFVAGLLLLLLARNNYILLLVALELLLLGIVLSFICWSLQMDDLMGLFFSLVILTLAAAESAIGLALAVSYYKLQNDILLERMYILKG